MPSFAWVASLVFVTSCFAATSKVKTDIGHFTLDCQGTLHFDSSLAPGLAETHAYLGTLTKSFSNMHESFMLRAQCECPDLTTTELATNFGIVDSFLQVAENRLPQWSDSCPQQNFQIQGFSDIMRAMLDPNTTAWLLGLHDVSSCSQEKWNEDGKCMFAVLGQNSALSGFGSEVEVDVALAKCPNSNFPYIYAGLNMDNLPSFCSQSSPCASGICFPLPGATEKAVNQYFTTFGLFQDINVENQCGTGVKIINDMFEYMHENHGGWNFRIDGNIGICVDTSMMPHALDTAIQGVRSTVSSTLSSVSSSVASAVLRGKDTARNVIRSLAPDHPALSHPLLRTSPGGRPPAPPAPPAGGKPAPGMGSGSGGPGMGYGSGSSGRPGMGYGSGGGYGSGSFDGGYDGDYDGGSSVSVESSLMWSFGAWDGNLPQEMGGAQVVTEERKSGAFFAADHNLFVQQPHDSGLVSIIGAACSQIYYFVLKHVGFAVDAPHQGEIIDAFYNIIEPMEKCRGAHYGNHVDLTDGEVETRFAFWGLPSFLYQLIPRNMRPSVGPKMDDWLFTNPQQWNNNQPYETTPLNVGFQAIMPDTCNYDNFMKTGKCQFDFPGFNSFPGIAGHPQPKQLDILVAGRRCPNKDDAALPQAGIWYNQGITSVVECSTLGQACKDGRVCEDMSWLAYDVFNESDPIGQTLFRPDSDAYRKCGGVSHFAKDLHNLLLHLDGQPERSDTDLPLRYCSFLTGNSMSTADQSAMFTWAQKNFDLTQLQQGVMKMTSATSWDQPVYPRTPQQHTHGDKKDKHIGAIVGGVIAGCVVIAVASAATYFVVRRRRKSTAALQAHHELREV
eukprot:CAMPEP_0117019704 /NCGR_PEP_ID=MMETSP0472-20121206/15082_1 /TAXON_ID=693140 ORGANISM="Tiarina fusus, Strain LIS" /NCGR_SAMPLE_ID=MMETSP0472 /ASSEMBLY_ACC=CAM_ASM_000603 /LENGTH=841 /DNA_ID=CAMNT_0004724735 /DNA_START=12 /DNA_END=2537 /DNA_ORIENTATION=+